MRFALRLRFAAAAVVVSLVVLFAPRARADPERETETVWYGYQTLLVDGAAAGLVLGTKDLKALGVMVYLGGPSLVHAAHGRSDGLAVGDFALRLTVPVITGLVIGHALQGPPSECDPSPTSSANSGANAVLPTACRMTLAAQRFATGALVGMAAMSVLDATVLARVTRPVKSSRVAWTPMITPASHAEVLGVVGTF